MSFTVTADEPTYDFRLTKTNNLLVNDTLYTISGETIVSTLDGDEDGFFFWDDCDDANSMINPSAIEILGNSIDENFDGIVQPSGLVELNGIEIFIYPNPVNDKLTIVQKGLVNAEVSLWTVTGMKLQSSILKDFNEIGYVFIPKWRLFFEY